MYAFVIEENSLDTKMALPCGNNVTAHISTICHNLSLVIKVLNKDEEAQVHPWGFTISSVSYSLRVVYKSHVKIISNCWFACVDLGGNIVYHCGLRKR